MSIVIERRCASRVFGSKFQFHWDCIKSIVSCFNLIHEQKRPSLRFSSLRLDVQTVLSIHTSYQIITFIANRGKEEFTAYEVLY
jgi:hypothetical protein